MEYKDKTPKQEENTQAQGAQDAPFEPATASTSRRTITAILVLIAALLLGYTLYDVLLSQPTPTQPMEQPEVTTEAPAGDENAATGPVSEYTEDEIIAILKAMSESQPEPSVTDADERRLIFEAMAAEAENELSEEEIRAILEAAMQ
jgi:hypothetical protein